LRIEGQPPNVAPEVVVLAAKKSVTLRIRIGKDGSVLEASVVDGDPILNDVAMEAVKTWRYQAYVLNGEPSEWTTDVVVNFGPKKTK
jgi:TonB family protein